ncbi:MAG TPA: ketopantoate reductase C-terminal domain-containing protein [Planctomycetota bacterium]|nr:ketopantoate reductase C-terminal domain-containing protein [Planctomycetota bacterium]
MTCGIFGPGLVGCFLGAAAGAPWTVAGPSGRPRVTRVRFSMGVRSWTPQVVAVPRSDLPMLVTTRVHRTPWTTLPADVLAAQNGLGQPRPVATCVFALDLDADGVLHATGPRPRLIVGPLLNAWAPVLSAWEAAGIQVERVADPRGAQWEKAVLNATVGPLCLGTGLSMAAVWNDPALRQLTIDATAEGEALGRVLGLPIRTGMVERATAFFMTVGNHQPSVVRDPGELPWVLGALLDAADRQQSKAPALRSIAALVARRLAASA